MINQLGVMNGQGPQFQFDGNNFRRRPGYGDGRPMYSTTGVGGATNLRTVNDPEESLARTSERDYQTYKGTYQGLIDDLLGMADSTDIIEGAQERVDILGERTAGIQNRNDKRTLASLSPAQKAAIDKRSKFNTAQESTATMNNARVDQRTVNQNRRQELIATAMNASQSGAQGMGQAAGMSANREMAYRNAKTQHGNQMLGTAATLGALAFMI